MKSALVLCAIFLELVAAQNSTAMAPATPGEAVGLTFFGNAACVIGASAPLLARKFGGERVSLLMAGAFGFAAGALTMGCLFDILPSSQSSWALVDTVGDNLAVLASWGSMLMGMVFYWMMSAFIRKLVPEANCPCHSHEGTKDIELASTSVVPANPVETVSGLVQHRAGNTSWTILLAMTLHHIPEGMLFYITATSDLQAGAVIGLILLIHVFPEGVSLGAPMLLGFPKQLWRAPLAGLISGFGQPLGALVAYGVFQTNQPDNAGLGFTFGFTAGLLMSIAVIGLFPFGVALDPDNKVVGWSVMAGAMVILFSISMFGVAGFNG